MKNLKLHSYGRRQNLEILRQELEKLTSDILADDKLSDGEKKIKIELLNKKFKKDISQSLGNNY